MATVVGKNIANQKRGDYFTPEHRIQYLISFDIEDEGEQHYKVDECEFDDYELEQYGELITQGDTVLDFIVEDSDDDAAFVAINMLMS